MVSNLVLGFLAIGVVSFAKTLSSPAKEIMLFSICAGVLLGAKLAQKSAANREDGPEPPPGWRWHLLMGTNGPKGKKVPPKEGGPEVLAYSGKDGAAEAKPEETLGFAIVPGNPGIPHLYCAMAEKLHEALVSSGVGPVTIYIIGHPNFATSAVGAKECEKVDVSGCQEEAESISVLISELRREHLSRGVVMCGHSIGAFCIQQHLLLTAAESTSLGPVPVAFFLTPYLEYHGPGHQGMLRSFTSMPCVNQFVWTLACVMTSLPKKVLRVAVGIGGVKRDDHREMVAETLGTQPHQLRAVVGLVRTEFSRLDPEVTEDSGMKEMAKLLKTPGRPPVVGLFTRKDKWGPEVHLPRLRELLSETDEAVDLGSDQNEPATLVAGKPVIHGVPLDAPHFDSLAKMLASRVASRVAKKK